MNPATERYCRSCHHEAHIARYACQCPRCATARRRVTGSDTPVPLADLIARAMSALRSQPPATDNLTDLSPRPNRRIAMTVANTNTPDTATAAREWKRTPVSAELASLIRALDDTLQATFGFDLCYVVMARDGIIAASTSVHGYMLPIVAPAPAEGVN